MKTLIEWIVVISLMIACIAAPCAATLKLGYAEGILASMAVAVVVWAASNRSSAAKDPYAVGYTSALLVMFGAIAIVASLAIGVSLRLIG